MSGKAIIVLIGSPAVGKSTLARELREHLTDAKVYSFDDLFPLEKIRISGKSSKEHRSELLLKVAQESASWIIVDDTTHLRSIQRSFRKLSLNSSAPKVVFVYLSALVSQIPVLIERNNSRMSLVSDREICNIVNWLNGQPPIEKNLIKFNFQSVPTISLLVKEILLLLSNYTFPQHVEAGKPDMESDGNFFNRLNIALNRAVGEAFKRQSLDGERVSVLKRVFLESSTCDSSIKSYSIEEIVEEFVERLSHI